MAPELMRKFFSEVEKRRYSFNGKENNLSTEEISNEEKRELVRKLGGYISYILDKEIKQNNSEKRFYIKMWDFISEDKLFIDDKDRATALYMLLINPRIPYFKTKCPYDLSREDYLDKMDKLCVLRQKARFIIYSPYETRSQEAMALLDLFDGIDDKEEQAILLASIIRSVESRST